MAGYFTEGLEVNPLYVWESRPGVLQSNQDDLLFSEALCTGVEVSRSIWGQINSGLKSGYIHFVGHVDGPTPCCQCSSIRENVASQPTEEDAEHYIPWQLIPKPSVPMKPRRIYES